MSKFGSPTSWGQTNGFASGGGGNFFDSPDDPFRRLQLAMALSGAASGMQQPRMAGWSAPFGGAARGLAQIMPYVAQMAMDAIYQAPTLADVRNMAQERAKATRQSDLVANAKLTGAWNDLGALKRFLLDDLLRERNAFAELVMQDVEQRREELK